jgi:hypothetical protein
MKKKIPRDPEKEARWEEGKRLLQERLDFHQAKIRERREQEERRRRRLQRVTFGLFPR